MYIEDVNRPKLYRQIERLLFFTGRIRTTGIMQQASDEGFPLSDAESVVWAAQHIQGIWDQFLRRYAQFRLHQTNPDYGSIQFSNQGYHYEFDAVYSQLQYSFSWLYGDYCGTRLLHYRNVLSYIHKFFLRHDYGMSASVILVNGVKLFPEFSALFKTGRMAVWTSELKIEVVGLREIRESGTKIHFMRFDGQLADLEAMSEMERREVISIERDVAGWVITWIEPNDEEGNQ